MATPPSPAAADLSAYRGKNRLFLVFAPSAKDKRYQAQYALWAGHEAVFLERDLRGLDILEVIPPLPAHDFKEDLPVTPVRADALRKRFGVPHGAFRVFLVGKDGHTAFSSNQPVSAHDLFARIDAMPMRREEMRRKSHVP